MNGIKPTPHTFKNRDDQISNMIRGANEVIQKLAGKQLVQVYLDNMHSIFSTMEEAVKKLEQAFNEIDPEPEFRDWHPDPHDKRFM